MSDLSVRPKLQPAGESLGVAAQFLSMERSLSRLGRVGDAGVVTERVRAVLEQLGTTIDARRISLIELPAHAVGRVFCRWSTVTPALEQLYDDRANWLSAEAFLRSLPRDRVAVIHRAGSGAGIASDAEPLQGRRWSDSVDSAERMDADPAVSELLRVRRADGVLAYSVSLGNGDAGCLLIEQADRETLEVLAACHVVEMSRLGELAWNAVSRVRQLEQVRDVEKRLEEAQAVAGLSFWLWSPGSSVFSWQGSWFGWLRKGDRGQVRGLATFLGAFMPESRSSLQRDIALCQQSSNVVERELEWQLPGADGQLHRGWVLLQFCAEASDPAISSCVIRGSILDITAIKRSEIEARQARKRLDQIVGQAPIAMFAQHLDGDASRYTFVSASGQRMFGLSERKLSRWNAFRDVVHPSDWSQLLERQTRLCGEGYFSAEYRIQIPGVGWHWVQEESTVVESPSREPGLEVVGIWIDVHGRKEAEARQREIELLYKDLVENAPAMIAVLNADLTVRFFNSAFSEYFADRLESSYERQFTEFLCESERERFRVELDGCSLQSPCRSFELRVLSTEKEVRWTSWSVRAFPDEGYQLAYQVVGRDNTEVREIQNQLFHTARLSELGKMAIGIGHEINQPLNVIRLAAANALASVQKDLQPNESLRGKLGRIQDQVVRITRIVENLRSYGRRTHVAEESFDPLVAMEGAWVLMEEQFRRNGITLDRQMVSDRVRVRGSVVLLEQILVNLLSNAKDAMVEYRESHELGPGGVIRVHGAVNTAGTLWEFRVVDQGGGVPAWVVPKLFAPFFTTKPKDQGTGLGLSVCRELADRLGGSIHLDNLPGGACFVVRVPCEIIEPPAVESDEKPIGDAAGS